MNQVLDTHSTQKISIAQVCILIYLSLSKHFKLDGIQDIRKGCKLNCKLRTLPPNRPVQMGIASVGKEVLSRGMGGFIRSQEKQGVAFAAPSQAPLKKPFYRTFPKIYA